MTQPLVDPPLLTSDGTALTRVLFAATAEPSSSTEPCAVLDDAVARLKEYFAGERTTFDLRVAGGDDPQLSLL